MAKYHHNDCSRAALIHFKDGVTHKQAQDALREIERVLKPLTNWDGDPIGVTDYVQEYDPTMGGPVWYIP
jgi:hypothetical protein